jgi:carbonic anhydrase
MSNNKSSNNLVLIFISQVLIASLLIFIYHKYIIEKPHILETGNNSFTSQISRPSLDTKTDYIHPTASIIGKVFIGHRVFVSPQASIRGDEGTPIYIGNKANIQDGVVIHALETEEHGETIKNHLLEEHKLHKKFAVYIGNKVSLAHQSQVHGPAIIEDNTFIGMQAFVFNSVIEENCVIEPAAVVIGVHIPKNHYVKAGSIINSQALADALPLISEDYEYKNINKAVVNVNSQLATTYNKKYGY